jgi:hypothetical protein
VKGEYPMPEDKYYKIFTIRFRKEEDAELIKELEAHGTSKRQWLHDLYYLAPEIPKDLCSIKDVADLMALFRVHPQTRRNIIEALEKKCKK